MRKPDYQGTNIRTILPARGSAALGQQPVNLKIPQTWPTIPLGNSVYALPEAQSIRDRKLRQVAKMLKSLNGNDRARFGWRTSWYPRYSIQTNWYFTLHGEYEGIGMAYGVNGIMLKQVPDMQINLRKFRIYRVFKKYIFPENLLTRQSCGTKPEVLGRLTQNEWRKAGQAQVSGDDSTDRYHA